MNKCEYYREEAPLFKLTNSEGFEIEMISICGKPGLREMGAPSDIVPDCDGDVDKCPYKGTPGDNELSGSIGK